MSTTTPTARISLFGSLLSDSSIPSHQPIQLELEAPTPVFEVLNLLPIASDKVQLVMLNPRAVNRDHVIHPGDRVSLFPKEYPSFPDWKDFRF